MKIDEKQILETIESAKNLNELCKLKKIFNPEESNSTAAVMFRTKREELFQQAIREAKYLKTFKKLNKYLYQIDISQVARDYDMYLQLFFINKIEKAKTFEGVDKWENLAKKKKCFLDGIASEEKRRQLWLKKIENAKTDDELMAMKEKVEEANFDIINAFQKKRREFVFKKISHTGNIEDHNYLGNWIYENGYFDDPEIESTYENKKRKLYGQMSFEDEIKRLISNTKDRADRECLRQLISHSNKFINNKSDILSLCKFF